MLRAARTELQIDVPKLFAAADAPWWHLSGDDWQLLYEQDEQGRSNWSQPASTQAPPDRDSRPPNRRRNPALAFQRVELNNLVLHSRAGLDAQPLRLTTATLQKDTDGRLHVDVSGDYAAEPVRIAGILALPSSERAREVALELRLLGVQGSLQGNVGHDGITPGRAQLQLRAKDLSLWSAFTGLQLQTLAPLRLDVELQLSEREEWRWKLDGKLVQTQVHSAGRMQLSTQPLILQLHESSTQFGSSQLRAMAQINATAGHFNLVASSTRLDLNELMQVVGDLSSDGSEDSEQLLALQPIVDLLSAWTGAIEMDAKEILVGDYQLQNLSGTLHAATAQAVLQARLDALSTVAEQGEVETLLGPLTLQSTLAYGQGTQRGAGNPSLISTVNGEGIELSLNAPADRRDAGATITAQITQPQWLGMEATAALAQLLPLTLETRLHPRSDGVRFSPLQLTGKDSRLSGSLDIETAGPIPVIRGTLESDELDLNRIKTTSGLTASASSEDTAAEEGMDQARDGDLLSDEPLDWNWLCAAELDLRLRIQRLLFNQTTFRDARAQLTLLEGELQLKPLRADLSEGKIRGEFSVRRAATDAASIKGHLFVTGLTPADLGQKDKGLIDGGETDLFFELAAQGSTTQGLADSLQGELALEVQRASFRNSLLDIIGSDLLMQTLTMINPFVKQEDNTDLECAAIRFVAQDGVLTSPDQLVVETSRMKIRGGGTINLRDETLQIDFVPSARKGLGISLGSLAKFVRLGGTLANPRPEADPVGILRSGATIGTAIATGGLSLLGQGLFARARNQGTACGKIFENNAEPPSAANRT